MALERQKAAKRRWQTQCLISYSSPRRLYSEELWFFQIASLRKMGGILLYAGKAFSPISCYLEEINKKKNLGSLLFRFFFLYPPQFTKQKLQIKYCAFSNQRNLRISISHWGSCFFPKERSTFADKDRRLVSATFVYKPVRFHPDVFSFLLLQLGEPSFSQVQDSDKKNILVKFATQPSNCYGLPSNSFF